MQERKELMSGNTIVDYISASSYLHIIPLESSKTTQTGKSKTDELEPRKAFHKSTEPVLAPLAIAAKRGVDISTSEGVQIRVRLLIASYVAGLPETK